MPQAIVPQPLVYAFVGGEEEYSHDVEVPAHRPRPIWIPLVGFATLLAGAMGLSIWSGDRRGVTPELSKPVDAETIEAWAPEQSKPMDTAAIEAWTPEQAKRGLLSKRRPSDASKFYAGSLCGKYSNKDMVKQFETYCNDNSDEDISGVTGGDYTKDFCKSFKSTRRRRRDQYDEGVILGPCKDPWTDHSKVSGCSKGSHRCLFGDYCVDSSFMPKGYSHNVCCGQTHKGPYQCYPAIDWTGFDADNNCDDVWRPGGNLNLCTCPSSDNKKCVACGRSSSSYSNRITARDAGRRLMMDNIYCDAETGEVKAMMGPCDPTDFSVGLSRNWFCNRADGTAHEQASKGGKTVMIPGAQTDSDSPVWTVFHPESYNTSDPMNFQVYAIDRSKAYSCQPCSSFDGQVIEGWQKFNAKDPKYIGKWCSVHAGGTSGNLRVYAGCSDLNKLGALDCKDEEAKECCTACPADDQYVGKLGWMCKKGTNQPCVNRWGISVVNQYASKLLPDNVSVVYPPLGSVVNHKQCTEMTWCKALKITAVVLSIVLPVGFEVAIETGFLALTKEAIDYSGYAAYDAAFKKGFAKVAKAPAFLEEFCALNSLADIDGKTELINAIKGASVKDQQTALSYIAKISRTGDYITRQDFAFLADEIYGAERLTCLQNWLDEAGTPWDSFDKVQLGTQLRKWVNMMANVCKG